MILKVFLLTLIIILLSFSVLVWIADYVDQEDIIIDEDLCYRIVPESTNYSLGMMLIDCNNFSEVKFLE